MRHFKDGDELYLEPWRARAFPVVKDLVVDRSAFDRIIAAGGFISVATGSAPDGNAVLVPKDDAERAMDAATWSWLFCLKRSWLIPTCAAHAGWNSAINQVQVSSTTALFFDPTGFPSPSFAPVVCLMN